MNKGVQKKILYNGRFLTVWGVPREGDKLYEFVEVTDSVAILVYIKDKKKVIMIQEPRVAMVSEDNPEGLVTSVPAGRFDLKIAIKDLVIKELEEEAGIFAKRRQVKILNGKKSLSLSAGVLTEKQYLIYVEVDSSQVEVGNRIFGNPKEGEKIKRIFAPIGKLKKMKFETLSAFALAQWFFANKIKK